MKILVVVWIDQPRAYFKAKVFGGDDVLRYYKGGQDNFFYLGEINCRFVREFLRNETIPVTTSDLGRDYGKIVHFRSTDFSAYLNIISHSQDIQVVNSEYKYWQQNIHKHEHEKDEIQIW